MIIHQTPKKSEDEKLNPFKRFTIKHKIKALIEPLFAFKLSIMEMIYEIKKISEEETMKLLKEDGIIINKEQALKIRDFMYIIAEITVDTYLSKGL